MKLNSSAHRFLYRGSRFFNYDHGFEVDIFFNQLFPRDAILNFLPSHPSEIKFDSSATCSF